MATEGGHSVLPEKRIDGVVERRGLVVLASARMTAA
jgi:hypothetical protein